MNNNFRNQLLYQDNYVYNRYTNGYDRYLTQRSLVNNLRNTCCVNLIRDNTVYLPSNYTRLTQKRNCLNQINHNCGICIEPEIPTNPIIITLSSGLPITLTSTETTTTPAIIGFGKSTTATLQENDVIDLTTATDQINNYTISVLREGVLQNLNVYFTATEEATINGNLNVTARVYLNNNQSNIFTPITNTEVNLTPTLTNTIVEGITLSGNLSNLNVNVTPQTKLLLVITANTTGSPLLNTISGNVSATIAIK